MVPFFWIICDFFLAHLRFPFILYVLSLITMFLGKGLFLFILLLPRVNFNLGSYVFFSGDFSAIAFMLSNFCCFFVIPFILFFSGIHVTYMQPLLYI